MCSFFVKALLMEDHDASEAGALARIIPAMFETLFITFETSSWNISLYRGLSVHLPHTKSSTMKRFLKFTTSFFLFLFLAITLLVFFHEPPSGPADEPYIAYDNFWSNWGKVILIIWAGSLVSTVVGKAIRPKDWHFYPSREICIFTST